MSASRELEFASGGHMVFERRYLQVGGDDIIPAEQLGSFAVDATQLILKKEEEGLLREQAIVSIGHGALIEMMQDFREVIPQEKRALLAEVFNSDIFGWCGIRATYSDLSPASFRRWPSDEDEGISRYSFYLPARKDLQVTKWNSRGNNVWWAKYRARFWPMGDV